MEQNPTLAQLIAALRDRPESALRDGPQGLAAALEQAVGPLRELAELCRATAHDTINDLTPVVNELETLALRLAEEEQRVEVELARDALLKVTGQMSYLQKQARAEMAQFRAGQRAQQQLDSFDLAALTQTLARYAQRRFRGRVRVDCEVPSYPVYIQAARSRIEGVIAELIYNASRYIPQDGSGVITLRLADDDQCARLQVTDNGPGIPRDLRERIFDTSFALNGQSGLGLAVARRVLFESQGRIVCPADWSGSGACFQLVLPCLPPAAPARAEDEAYGEVVSGASGAVFQPHRTLRIGQGFAYVIGRGDGDEEWLKLARASHPAVDLLQKEVAITDRLRRSRFVPELVDAGAGFYDGSPVFYVRQRASGGQTLDEVINSVVLPAAAVLWLAEQAAEMLVEFHAAGILCRSLAPASFVVGRDLFVAADLGAPVFASAERGRRPARAEWGPAAAHEPAADLRYIAPEHYHGFTPDERSDIFAYGLLIYELVTTRPLFGTRASHDALQLRRGRAQLPPLNSLDSLPWLPEDLAHVIRRCLAYRPEQRYPNAEALLADVSAIKAIWTREHEDDA